ncbi:hypothetical protein [Oleiharenicola sp. Vm1]|uniref:hypothetical protein n=1 Tax=Oleiharenicola sp. Vm1 TaxID=3398393 RepID=UPI0039F47F3D
MSSTPAHAARAASARRHAAVLIFGAWFVATSLFGAWTVAQHVVPLPAAATRDVAHADRPRARHVLGADCGCSASIGRDLIKRGPRPGWEETVVLLDAQPELERGLRAAGFAVQTLPPENAARTLGVQGAPWLSLHFPDGRVAYDGGYARLRPGLPGYENLDAALMHDVEQGRAPARLAAYGCATSQSLRDRLDPWHLKYPASQ